MERRDAEGSGPSRPESGVDADVPEHIGPFRILERLGEGGMGVVYLGEQKEPVRRRAAIKVVKLGMDSQQVLRRFEAERQALAMMDHPNIARVFEAGSTPAGRPWFAMEHVRGIPLTDYCDQARLAIEQRLGLFLQVCAGVQHAHHKGVIHRDLTPRNILVAVVEDTVTAKIIDFGLARATDHRLIAETLHTEQGVFLGTPQYMSPEQAGLGGLDIDTRTDIYSLGVVLYELVAGQPPFDGHQLRQQGLFEMQRRIREEEPKRPSTQVTTSVDLAAEVARLRRTDTKTLVRRLRGDLDWIVLKAIEKDRTRRYASAEALADDVRRFLRDEPVAAAAPTMGYRARKFVRRNRPQVFAAAAAGVSLVLALVAVVQAWRDESVARAEIEVVRQRLGQALQLVAGDRLEIAVARARDLVPPWPEQVAAMQAWLAEWTGFVAAREPAIRRAVDELDGEGLDPLEAGYLRARLQELQVRLRTFAGDGGPIADVRERLRWAESIHERSVSAPADAWRRAIAAVRRSDGVEAASAYAGLELREQIGLVPVGMDPDSLLWEFADLRSGRPPERGADGRLRIGPDTGIVFVLVPGGSDELGADIDGPNADPKAQRVEGPVRNVRMPPFLIAKHELTQGQWERLGGGTPSRYSAPPATPCHPVEMVAWHDARERLRAWGMELPSEDEWEYACRAGTDTSWPGWGSRDELLDGPPRANLADAAAAAARQPHGKFAEQLPGYGDGYPVHAPVGSFPPNAFGLHDMAGNVWEWCRDSWADRRGERDVATPGRQWVVRGGSFASPVEELRSACRRGVDSPYHNVGLRPARRLIGLQ